MKKTLLLVFIHGFKGGETTFGEKYKFTADLRDVLAEELPKIDVKVLVYPKYETQGDLSDCVEHFRDWLLEKVIDLEVAAGTPSPTVDPSVRVVLIGHSMGGIVAAETVIALTSDEPVPFGSTSTEAGGDDSKPTTAAPAGGAVPGRLNSLMFPYVQGVLAFDTPYLGISPGVVAHSAEGHYATASAAITQLGGLAGLFGAGAAAGSGAASRAPAGAPALPAAAAGNAVGGGAGGWGKWGRIAMYSGAAVAVAGAGAAAYLNRDQIGVGWGWVSSHLEFVGCLARGEELKRRVSYMATVQDELGVGFANLYTRLGKSASQGTGPGLVATNGVSVVGAVMGSDRTFCNLPNKMKAGTWMEAINDKATDETTAHMTMFEAKENPSYHKLAIDAADLITSWTKNDWYESSVRTSGLLTQ